MALAATTVPCAEAPLSITVLPSTVIGSATVAEKSWPAWLLFELSVSPRRTVTTVPAGMVTACSAATVFLAGAPLAFAVFEFPAPELSVLVAGVFEFWEQPSIKATSRAINK
ncbi:MAG: hypothetical protein DMG65_15330 [Candidatus Angelobacter sp. Gp1-AA117]|nr:MAG: hypothetical protein DMG65_15330 [Candidatus Angelobacter sp. Gp1-AA117]